MLWPSADALSSANRRQIQTLEARLTHVRKRTGSQQLPVTEIASFAAEKAALLKNNAELREENNDMKDEVEEMRAMVEVLKGQLSGRKGLVSDPRASPLSYTM